MGNIGNTFKMGSLTLPGRAKKVWREIRHQYPAGGKIANVSDWSSAGLIPAGTPCKYDSSAKTVTAYKDATITGTADASALAALGINGYTQEDIYLDGATIATATVIYDGEIYDYFFSSAMLAKIVGLVPQVIFVH